MQRLPPTFLINEINEATDVGELAASHGRLSEKVKTLIDRGVHAGNITRIITSISDAVLDRLLHFALSEYGEPPVAFAFLSLGREGRGEQALATNREIFCFRTRTDQRKLL